MFAIALSLVLLISAAILLYQFWAGSLLGDDAGEQGRMHTMADEPRPAPEAPTTFRANTAA